MATTAQSIAQHGGAFVRIEDAVPLTVTATANTDFAFNIPAGARNVSFRVKTTTAFGAATDAQLQIGKTLGGAEYVAGTTIKALGDYSFTLVGTNISDLDTVTGSTGFTTAFTARIVQSGTASATGAASLYVSYAMPV
jgi:hypothetical protein